MDAMSCLAPPPRQAPFLGASSSPGPAYYTDAAIARALHFSSMPEYEYDYDYDYSPAVSSPSSASAPSSSSLLADLPCGSSWLASTAAPPTVSLTCDSLLVASDAGPRPPSTPVAASAAANKRRVGLGPNAAGAGRAGKRRARASKRAPTTYISTDPANFRLMVQHVTGVQAEPGAPDGSGELLPASSFDASSAAALLDCPQFDGAAFADALRLPADADAAALHRQHQQQLQQPCFPTLDSWSVMYESTQLL